MLELCAITGTLVIDEDGVYNPAEFNDRGLVLGMKGTFAQAEVLHIIRARLHGGKLNKALRGDLRFALPVGLIFDDDKIVLDPDREVQGAVRTVFELFGREGTAYGVVRRFQELGLRFPRGAYRRRMERQAALGPADAFARARYPGQSLVCRRLCVRTLSILEAGEALRRDRHPLASGGPGCLAGDDTRSP